VKYRTVAAAAAKIAVRVGDKRLPLTDRTNPGSR
jgi:hypothetical protein